MVKVILSDPWHTFRNIAQDPDVYPNPQTFDPDRFMPISDLDQKSGRVPQLDPREYFFGYGRRVCLGMHLSQATAWTAMAYLLASFDISLKDSELTVKPEFVCDGIMR